MPINAENIALSPNSLIETDDSLSILLARLKLSARVFLRADFCGNWAVDTSGERRAPFHLVTRGASWVHADDAEPLQLTAGDLVVFPHDSAHTLSGSEQEPNYDNLNIPADPDQLSGSITGLMCGYFSFDQRAAAPLLDGLPNSIVLHLNDSARHHETASLIQLWMNEASAQAPGCDAAIDQLAYVVFIHVIRDQLQRGLVHGPLEALADQRLGAALNQIHANPGGIESVDQLAAIALMSRSAFAERFKKLVGLTPARYLSHWRMQLAVELLTTTDIATAEIAELCGYRSEVAFRKAFRAVVGHPPGKIRRDARSKLA